MSSESLRARLEAATPGPWQSTEATVRAAATPEPKWGPWPGDDAPDEATAAYWAAEHEWDQWWEASTPVAPNDLERIEDADLIAHAPTDLRLALDVIDKVKSCLNGNPYAADWAYVRDALDAFEEGT